MAVPSPTPSGATPVIKTIQGRQSWNGISTRMSCSPFLPSICWLYALATSSAEVVSPHSGFEVILESSMFVAGMKFMNGTQQLLQTYYLDGLPWFVAIYQLSPTPVESH